MGEVAVRVEGLSKRYRLGTAPVGGTAYDAITAAIRAPFRRLGQRPSGHIWALKDVSFDLHRGEVLGIIGRNGAGKTTLLKILSRITEPTEGAVDLYGRVSSLLEVGTGFHPELTGRENIFLNGAILGMRRAEIARRFDEIVAFAEVEPFLDTPVKHYSSGMYLRLAFAVAAHLEPEILLVDEVLAVGDAAFQRKCLGKMGDVVRGGRTIVFVSHNIAAVSTLCQKVALLRAGRMERIGPPAEVIRAYVEEHADDASSATRAVPDDEGHGYTLVNAHERVRVCCGDPISLSFEVVCPQEFANATAGVVIYDLLDSPVIGASSKFQGVAGAGSARRWYITCELGQVPLNAGRYYGSLWFGNEHRDYARFRAVVQLEVTPADPFGWGDRIPESWGHLYWSPAWRIVPSQRGAADPS